MVNKKKIAYTLSALAILMGGVYSATEVSADALQSTVTEITEEEEPASRAIEDSDVWDPSHPWWNATIGDMVIVNGEVVEDGNATGRWHSAVIMTTVGRVIDYKFEDGTTAAESVDDLWLLDGNISWNYRGEVSHVRYYSLDPFNLEEIISPKIDGYTADIEVVPATEWDLNKETQHITVTYKPIAAEDTPVDSSTPTVDTPATPSSPAPASPIGDLEKISQVETEPIITAAAPGPVVTAPKAEGARLLPATGDEGSGTAILVAGVSMLAAGVVGLAARLKRKR